MNWDRIEGNRARSKPVADSWITAKVKAGIFNEPSLKVSQINVETCKNVVQLSGFVDATASMSKAVAIARSVKDVISVKNEMQFRSRIPRKHVFNDLPGDQS